MDLTQSIIDHAKHPHNFGELPQATNIIKEGNQGCGDLIQLYLQIEEGIVVDVKFKGLGCSLSVASASLLTDYIKGKTVSKVKEIDSRKMFELLGTEVSPGRLRCVLLPLEALKKL